VIYLVRHVKAGDRHDWRGRDERRPISDGGRRQADGLARWLGGEPVKRIVSSPYVRCVESMQPLAGHLGLDVETSDALAEGAPVDAAVALVAECAAEDSVLCSHGDVIPAVLDALAHADGLALPPDFPCAKGSTWVLDGDGRPFASARYVAPVAGRD
jgi:8-oxo-dGTP diphosphatase